MDVNDDASCLEKRAIFETFASKLAPTHRSGGPDQIIGP